MAEQLKVGAVLKDVYNSTRNFIRSKNADLADRVHSHFGFGIGYSIKEDRVIINGQNSRKVRPGMVFHAKITFQKPADKGKGVYVAIGDTVVVKSADQEAEFKTRGIPRKPGQISYELDDKESEEQEEIKEAANGNGEMGLPLRRTRGGN